LSAERRLAWVKGACGTGFWAAFLCIVAFGPSVVAQQPSAPSPLAPATKPGQETLILETGKGAIIIALRSDLAPLHVARIRQLVQRGFYNGLAFHRVIAGYMAQSGDPSGHGFGGTGRYLPLEASGETFVRGAVAMARGAHKDSADSQFFILLAPAAPDLDGKYTLWGKVIAGMPVADKLKAGASDRDGRVSDPDRILCARLSSMPACPPTKP
jgi:peptidylprolyl isomerase